MNPSDLSADKESKVEEAPRLPGLSSWRAVYVFVLVVFVSMVALLAVLTAVYG